MTSRVFRGERRFFAIPALFAVETLICVYRRASAVDEQSGAERCERVTHQRVSTGKEYPYPILVHWVDLCCPNSVLSGTTRAPFENGSPWPFCAIFSFVCIDDGPQAVVQSANAARA
jgi:hypothetical protein